LPSPGRIQGLRVPQGPGVRDDSGAYEGGEVPIFYDPMISKLITWGDNRDHALQRMRRALAEYDVRGIRTTIPFFKWILEDADFKAGRFDTSFIDRKLANGAALQSQDAALEELAAIAAAVHVFTKPARRGSDAVAAPSRWKDAGRAESVR
jgi:acetyl/propionyl-CoA carboxylase alpha subunit